MARVWIRTANLTTGPIVLAARGDRLPVDRVGPALVSAGHRSTVARGPTALRRGAAVGTARRAGAHRATRHHTQDIRALDLAVGADHTIRIARTGHHRVVGAGAGRGVARAEQRDVAGDEAGLAADRLRRALRDLPLA